MVATSENEQNRTTAILTTLIFHAAFLAILWLYKLQSTEVITENPAIVLDWGGGGDDAALGEPDQGKNSTPAPTGDDGSEAEAPAEKPAPQPPTSVPDKAKPTVSDKADVPKNTPTTTDPDVAAAKQKAENDKRQKAEQDRQTKEKARAEADAKEKQRQAELAEADRKRKEKEAYDKKKGQMGGGFGKPGGTGQGTGSGGNTGNQGSPTGTPDGKNPFGTKPGQGGGNGGGSGGGDGSSVGGGLGGRDVKSRPRVNDDSQKQGTVRIEVCVNANGTVLSATPTQSGSSTTDSELRSIAVAAAKKYVFEPSSAEKQCGWIDFKFKLQ